MPSSTLDIASGYFASVQRKISFTQAQFRLIRQIFFQFVGFFVLLYFFSQVPILLYLLLKLSLRFIFQIFSIIFWTPLKLVELCLPENYNYDIIFPLFWLCSFISFSIAKFSHKTFGRRHSFLLTFIILLSLQSLFILLPVATSVREQRKLSTTSNSIEQRITEYAEIIRSHDNHRKEFLSKTKINEATTNLSEQNKNKSDVEDEQNINTTNQLFTNSQIFSNEELQFNSKVLENSSSDFIQKQKNFFRKSLFHKWLAYISHKLSFNLFSSSEQYFLEHNITSIYSAFTDLNCYDYTKSSVQYKQNYMSFLNTYRRQSPFPIYLSIIKSNGPRCYPHYPKSSCAINSNRFASNSKNRFTRFTRFAINVIILIIILKLISKYLLSRQKTTHQSVNEINKLSTEPIICSYPLDKNLENQLYIWLQNESNNSYKNIIETYRIALNERFSIKNERLSIETIQYDNAKISNVTQTSLETIVINATLDIDRLILNLIKDQQFSIKISKLTGELEVLLNNNIIKVKFKQIQLVDTEIINSHQIFSYDEKQSIIKLFTDVITQTIVQYCLYLSDNQEMTPPVTLPTPPQTMPVAQHFETPIIAPVVTPTINQQIIPHEKQVKKLLVRIVKAVKLHDVEQPFCVLELNNPNQIHQTSIAKNGVNPFWDERFLFECNDKSNAIHLQIIDRRKPTKKMPLHNLDILYADVSIPFSYVTSTIYKQDVRITPRYPDSIIRIEFSTLTEEDELAANHGDDPETPTDSPLCLNTEHETNHIPNNHRSSTSDEILTLASNANTSFKDYHTHNYATTDRFITSTPLASFDDSKNLPKPRKSRSFMNSFRIFSRRKKGKENENENGLISSYNTSTPTNTISPSASAEPFVSKNSSSFHRHGVISESFRNFFRSKSKKTNIDTSNFIVDHPESLGTLTSTSKKRSFFQRFKSKHKHHIGSSRNSLTSNDCTRTESVRNTPVRANVGRPVTMIK